MISQGPGGQKYKKEEIYKELVYMFMYVVSLFCG